MPEMLLAPAFMALGFMAGDVPAFGGAKAGGACCHGCWGQPAWPP